MKLLIYTEQKKSEFNHSKRHHAGASEVQFLVVEYDDSLLFREAKKASTA
jgi:hypothetical protein